MAKRIRTIDNLHVLAHVDPPGRSSAGYSLANCTQALLDKISCPKCTRRDVAQTYALALASVENDQGHINWPDINRAIVERWSPSALNYIKRLAWSGRCFESRSDTVSENPTG